MQWWKRLNFIYLGSEPDRYPGQWVIRISSSDPVTTLIHVECQIKMRLELIPLADISVLASALDPRYELLKFLDAEKIWKFNYKTRSVNLHLMERPIAVLFYKTSPPPAKKALDIFKKREILLF